MQSLCHPNLRLVSLCLLFTTLPCARAGTVTYTDLPSFLNDVGPGYYLETYDGYPWGQNIGNDLSFSGGGFDYAGHAFGGYAYGTGQFYSDNVDLNGSPNRTLTVTQQGTTMRFDFGPNITAVGGTFFMLTVGWPIITDGIMTITLTDGTQQVLEEAKTPFFGFTSPTPIGSITVDSNRMSGMNDLYVGRALETAPEPGTLVLLASGAAILLATRRIRRAGQSL
jgi:hypothetical protein